MKRLLGVIVVTIILCGCASSGNKHLIKETAETVQAKIIPHKSTTLDVSNAYGMPLSQLDIDKNKAIWHYGFSHMKANFTSYIPIVGIFAGGSNGYEKNLDVFFENGIVDHYQFSNRSAHYEHGQVYYSN